MMRRVRLNMYRAEDEMFIIRKRQVIIRIGERQANKVIRRPIMADLFHSGAKKTPILPRSKREEEERHGRGGRRRT